jgi:hypothetical protein
MAAGKLSPLRGTGPLLRTTTFVAAAITAILLGTAASVAQGDENYEDPLLDIVSLSFVGRHHHFLDRYRDSDLIRVVVLFSRLVCNCPLGSLLPRIVPPRHRCWLRLSWVGR